MFVRLAMPYDLDDFVRMTVANIHETLPGEPYSVEKIRATFAQSITRAQPTIWVAEHQDRVVGFMAAYIHTFDYRDGLYVTQRVIYVSPEHRGTRAAVLLIKELIQWSMALGADRIDGGNDNLFQTERTSRFLSHFGFKQVGMAMRKELGSARDGSR